MGNAESPESVEWKCMHDGAHMISLCGQGGYMVGTFGCPICKDTWERRLKLDEHKRLLGEAKLILGDIELREGCNG